MSGVLAEGTLYVDQLVNGTYQGITKWEGVAKLEIKPNSELKESVTKDKGKYGQIAASVAINKPAELSLTIRDLNKDAMAMALQGSASVISQGSGTISAQVVTAKLGKFIDLGHKNIATAGFSVTNSAASTTYVKDTDYRVNYVMGFLEILSTGAITDAQSLKVNYGYGAISGNQILGATVPQVRGKIMLDGNNLVDGTPLILTIHDATLTADGAVDFMADDLIELSMKGRMTTPTGKPSPFVLEYALALS